MTLFKNTIDKKLYIIEDHGRYGLFAYGYFSGSLGHVTDWDSIGTVYVAVSII